MAAGNFLLGKEHSGFGTLWFRDSELTADQIAAALSGVSTIGCACHVLLDAGLRATIAGNRISVDDRFFVQYLGCAWQGADRDTPSWLIFDSAASAPPIIVTAGNSLPGGD
jgi:hypothetical protein